jgi:hypothetical protein
MPPESERDIRMNATAAERAAIITGIGEVTSVWATLEDNLFSLFLVLTGLSGDQAWDERAGIIFYTPSNTETRIALVDNLVSYHCEMRKLSPPADEIDDRLLKNWHSIKGKIDRLKNTRNAIVHGSVGSVGSATKSTSRLTPAFGDTLRFPRTVPKGSFPGLGSNEIKTHSQAVWTANNRVAQLTGAFRLRMQLPHHADPLGVIRTLLEMLPREVRVAKDEAAADPPDPQ